MIKYLYYRNIVFNMINRKILVSNNDLFNQDYKLSYFCESLSKYEENHVKTENNHIIMSKKLKK